MKNMDPCHLQFVNDPTKLLKENVGFKKEMHQIEREILAEWYAYFDIIS